MLLGSHPLPASLGECLVYSVGPRISCEWIRLTGIERNMYVYSCMRMRVLSTSTTQRVSECLRPCTYVGQENVTI